MEIPAVSRGFHRTLSTIHPPTPHQKGRQPQQAPGLKVKLLAVSTTIAPLNPAISHAKVRCVCWTRTLRILRVMLHVRTPCLTVQIRKLRKLPSQLFNIWVEIDGNENINRNCKLIGRIKMRSRKLLCDYSVFQYLCPASLNQLPLTLQKYFLNTIITIISTRFFSWKLCN
jgi:hypothetical protein